MKSGFASPARSRSNSLQRGSGAQHIPCHAGRAAAFGIGRGEAPLQQPVQGNTALYSAQPFPPWFQAFRVSGIYKQLLLLPKLPPFGSPHPLSPLLRYSLAGTSRPRGCEIAALAPANKHQRPGEKKKEETQEENIELKSGHCFCCFKGFVLSRVSLGDVNIIIAVDNVEILSIKK